jgi:arabinogalactan oligomer/maltooligosaccharide transport system substrate-binding protein
VTDFLALLYNKAELKQALNTTSPPSNMSGFEQDVVTIAQKIPPTYGFETPGTGYNVLPFLYAFGGGMFDSKDGNIAIANTPSVDGLEFVLALEKMRNVKKMPVMHVNFASSPVSPVDVDFATGKTAMIFGGPYDVTEILAHGFNAKNLGIAAIPACPPPTPAFRTMFNFTPTCRPGQAAGSPSGGQSYVISAGTTHPIEAYEFISFMSLEQSQIEIAQKNGTLPTLTSAYTDKQLSGNAIFNEFHRLELKPGYVINRPAGPQDGHLFDAFDPNIAAALDDVETPSAALTAVKNAWEQLGI